jgi:hypothetical protein
MKSRLKNARGDVRMEKLEEVERILEKTDRKAILDIIHFLRIQHAEELFALSGKTYDDHEKKMQSIRDCGGVYFIVIVDPTGNVILYPGKTSGKSKTSGLRFRLKAHLRFLGKTPLTLFVPNWWIKRVYPIPLKDREKARELEKDLWMFLKKHSRERSRFDSLEDLEKKIVEKIRNHIEVPDKLEFIEFQVECNPPRGFMLKTPPAGGPRRVTVEVN